MPIHRVTRPAPRTPRAPRTRSPMRTAADRPTHDGVSTMQRLQAMGASHGITRHLLVRDIAFDHARAVGENPFAAAERAMRAGMLTICCMDPGFEDEMIAANNLVDSPADALPLYRVTTSPPRKPTGSVRGFSVDDDPKIANPRAPRKLGLDPETLSPRTVSSTPSTVVDDPKIANDRAPRKLGLDPASPTASTPSSGPSDTALMDALLLQQREGDHSLFAQLELSAALREARKASE